MKKDNLIEWVRNNPPPKEGEWLLCVKGGEFAWAELDTSDWDAPDGEV